MTHLFRHFFRHSMGALRSAACASFFIVAAVQGQAAETAKPIKVAALSALSGGAAFPESSQAAKAYFDTVNANGGIGGRSIQYRSIDEGTDPVSAGKNAAQLLADPELVALVGGAGVLDCAVNQKLYEDAGILSLQGSAVAPQCFQSANIVPVNNGPYMGLASAVTFSRERLKSKNLCVVVVELPGMVAGYTQAMQRLAVQTGKPSPQLQVAQMGTDWKPILNSLEAKGCDVVVFTGHEAAVLQWLQSAREMGMSGITWVFLAPGYTASVARVHANSADNIYALSDFEPWSSRSLSSLDWRELMRQARLPLSGLSQGGYLSAQILVRALRGIRGPITRASVTQALRQQPAQDYTLLGMPFYIGDASRHSPNRSSIPMRLVEGVWRIAAPDWTRLPDDY